MTLSSGSINLLDMFTHFTLTNLLRVMIKNTEEQPDKEIHRVRSGRVLSAGDSVPVELGCTALQVWICSPTWKLPEPYTLLGFYGGFLT